MDKWCITFWPLHWKKRPYDARMSSIKITVPLKVSRETRRNYKIVSAVTGIDMGELAKLALDKYKEQLREAATLTAN